MSNDAYAVVQYIVCGEKMKNKYSYSYSYYNADTELITFNQPLFFNHKGEHEQPPFVELKYFLCSLLETIFQIHVISCNFLKAEMLNCPASVQY